MKKTLLLAALATWAMTSSCKSTGEPPAPAPNPEQPVPPAPTPETSTPTPTPTPAEPTDRPSDYHLATRLTLDQPREKEADFLRTIKIEEFAWGRQQDAITLADLLPFVTFRSSWVDGRPYTLTEEDLKHLQISEMEFALYAPNMAGLGFKATYRGIPASQRLSVAVPLDKYFLQRIHINPDFAHQHFLGGVVANLGIYGGEIFQPYDIGRYAVELTDAMPDYAGDDLTVRAKVHLPRYQAEDVAVLEFFLPSFKRLFTLRGKLLLATSSELNEEMRRRFGKSKAITDEAILANLQPNPKAWLKLAQVSVPTENGSYGTLTWEENGDRLRGNTAGGVDTRDVWLDRVRFQVRSAHLDRSAGTLTIGVELVEANDQALQGLTATLVVRSQNY